MRNGFRLGERGNCSALHPTQLARHRHCRCASASTAISGRSNVSLPSARLFLLDAGIPRQERLIDYTPGYGRGGTGRRLRGQASAFTRWLSARQCAKCRKTSTTQFKQRTRPKPRSHTTHGSFRLAWYSGCVDLCRAPRDLRLVVILALE